MNGKGRPSAALAADATTIPNPADVCLDIETLPLYRSPLFHALADDDPRRLASMKRAADCWHRHRSNDAVHDDMVRELIALSAAYEDGYRAGVLRQWSREISTAVDWRKAASQPSHAELARRRAEVPRSHTRDFAGRSR